jgi:SBF-like CPA transporter family (DUF4137)
VLKRLSTLPTDTFCSAARKRVWRPVFRWRWCFFPAATAGVIMLPLMIFHQIQLVVCSVIASRLSRDPLPEAVGGEPGAGPLA